MLPPDIPWLFPALQSSVYSVSPPQNGLPWTPPQNQCSYHFQSPYSTYFSVWQKPLHNSFPLICLIVYDPSPQPECKFREDQDFSSFFSHCYNPHCLEKTRVRSSIHRFKWMKSVVSGFLTQLLESQAPHSEIKVMPRKNNHAPNMIWPKGAACLSPLLLSPCNSLICHLNSNDIPSSHITLLTHTEHLMSTLLRNRYEPQLPINIYSL